MKRLYFIRHGESLKNVEGLLNGRGNSPLSENGQNQVRSAINDIKPLNIDLIVSSPSDRAIQTAKIIADGIGYKKTIEVSDLLKERDFGKLENTRYSPHIKFTDEHNVEPLVDLLKRVDLALDWINSLPGDNVLMVSHGSFGRAVRSRVVTGQDFDSQHHFKNAAVTELL